MQLYSENKYYKLYHGNMLDMLGVIELNSIDSIVTDPPYELNFMGKGWDNAGVSFQKETWKKCFDVLKPGGYLLAFGGSRTFHRIACAIEDAGFEIRDTIMWLYGSGFPKSMGLGKAVDKKEGNKRIKTGKIIHHAQKGVAVAEERGAVGDGAFGIAHDEEETIGTSKWEGWGTALKPSFEPIIVARKPCEGSCVDNVIKWGVGGINIDECRVAFEDTPNPATNPLFRQEHNYKHDRSKSVSENSVVGFSTSAKETPISPLGRHPANTILTYDDTDYDEVCGGFPISGSGNSGVPYSYAGREYNNRETSMFNGDKPQSPSNYADSGSAARYFYHAKASKKDRDEGLDDFDEKRKSCYGYDLGYMNDGEGMFKERRTMKRNTHPTVKPCELMQYLIRLVTPKGGIILDPFNGSGSTGKAAMYENKERDANYKYVGIELTEEYLAISKARIEYVCNNNHKEEEVNTEQNQTTPVTSTNDVKMRPAVLW